VNEEFAMGTEASLAATAGLAVVAGLPAGLASAQSSSGAGGPMAKLIVAQRSINVPRYGKRAYIDPGVYVVAVGSPPTAQLSAGHCPAGPRTAGRGCAVSSASQ
jgi:hypothetical protein